MPHLFQPGTQFMDGSTVLASGTINVYDTGTTDAHNIYSDSALSVAATNPITLGSDGKLPSEIHTAGYVTVLIEDVNGSTVESIDTFLVPAINAATATDGDTTPSVFGVRVLTTANTSATTITDLDSGYTGQEVLIIIGDANTTIDFSSSAMVGNHGVDRAFTSGDVIKCVANSGASVWYCEVINNATNGTELTLDASGVITVTGAGLYTVDTNADASSDNLDTINGGEAGMVIRLIAASGARTVVARDGQDNLQLSGNITLDNAQDTLSLIYDGSNWLELSNANNGA